MQNPSILPSPRAIEKVPNREGNSDPGSENLAPGRRSKENGGAAKLTWLQAGGLLLGGLVVAAIIVEIGFRIFTRSYVPQAQRTDRPDQFFFPAHAKSDRDFDYSPVKPPGTYRIVVVGDSFTFGVGMQFEDAFPKRLERILRLGDNSSKIEVLNFGVPGDSSTQEVALVHKAIEYQADLILVELTLNDPEKEPYRATHATDNQGRLIFNSPLFDYWKSLHFIATRIFNTWTHHTFTQYYHDLFSNPETWGPFEKSYQEIKTITDRHNVALAVVIFPLLSHELDPKYPFTDIHQKVHEMLTADQIKFLDLFSTFRRIPVQRLQLIPGVDNHPNEIGHRLAAEAIYSWFVRKQILPQEFLQVPHSPHRLGDPRSLNRSIGIQ